MKKLITLIVMLVFVAGELSAARLCPSKGRVMDERGGAVEYATVVLLRDSVQVTGTATDAEGRFTLKAPAGDYTLRIQYLGYDPLTRQVHVAAESDLGDFVLRSSATQIEGVVVKARIVRREADRFVVDVADAPAAAGRDGAELLERAPGVWMDGEKISINGKGGTKVFVNDRELRMEPAQLMAYLRSLRAEEIQRIEIVPTAGADHDADAAGGIVLITLRKRREDGLQGSLSLRTEQSGLIHRYGPGGNVSIHSGRLDLNVSAYTAGRKRLSAASSMNDDDYNGGATLGAVYEFDGRNSLGAEFSYLHLNTQMTTGTSTDMTSGSVTNTASRYAGGNAANGYEGTFNYVRKIDTLGSTFKVLGDYAHRNTSLRNDNRSRIAPPAPAQAVDSLYRDRTRSSYDVAALTLALDKRFSERWRLRTGIKYTRNEMRNDARYEYLRGEAWTRNEAQSFEINYTEHIAAAYGVVTASLGRWSAVAGLRGEYTHTYGRGDVGQDYFSLFPNANLSCRLSEDGAYSLVAQYARTIERPRFWTLTPQRMQISDYTYQTGNPLLDPAYKQDVSLTLVLAHKYTLTGGVILQRDEINQTTAADADNPDMLGILWVNYDDTKTWYAAANLPIQPTEWLQINMGANYMRRGQRVEQHAPETFQHILLANVSATIELPANFYVDLSYRYQSRMTFGNATVEPMQFLNAEVKKRFGRRFTLSFSARSLLDEGQEITAQGDGFVRRVITRQPWCARSYQIGITCNFKSGKAFRKKSVEAGASEDKGRM